MSWTEGGHAPQDTVARRSELRRFGLAFGSGLTLVGGLLLWRGKAAGFWVLGVAAAVLLLGVGAPRLLRPLERLLSRLFRLVTAGLTYLLLTLSFFLVVTPIGLLARLFHRDLLSRRFPGGKESYWVEVEPDGPTTRPDKPY